MEVKRLFYAFLRKSWIMLILAILGGALSAYLFIYKAVPMYQADSTLIIMNQDKLRSGQFNYSDLNLSRQLVQDYSEIIKSREITSEVVSRLKDSYITQDILNSVVNVGFQKDSSILLISTVWSDPETAALITNTMSKVFVDKMRVITNSNDISILDKAQIPRSPLPNKGMKMILIGILTGLAIGFGIIYMIELFDTRIRAVEDVEYVLKLNVIGLIPEHTIK